MKKLNVAIIGQGRSGKNIHGRYFLSEENKLFNVVAVVDKIALRREKGKEVFGCEAYEDYTQLFERKDIDLVVNATFSHMHPEITVDLLNHGFNVLCEKPMARYVSECDAMIDAMNRNNVVLAIFQQARYASYHQKVKEVIKSGVLGEIIHIGRDFSGFGRRWDWQCSQRYYGGSILNSAPHPIDQVLDLLDFDENITVFSVLRKAITSGDAEDYAKVILTAPGKPLVDIEVSSCNSYNEYHYHVQGTCGSLRATGKKIEWKYYDPETAPAHELILKPLENPDGSPSFCIDELTWKEEVVETSNLVFSEASDVFYTSLYNRIVNGTPMEITPEQVRVQVGIIEQIHKQNPLEIIY